MEGRTWSTGQGVQKITSNLSGAQAGMALDGIYTSLKRDSGSTGSPRRSHPLQPQPSAQVPPSSLTWPVSSPRRAISLQRQATQPQKENIPRPGCKYISRTQRREDQVDKGSRGCLQPGEHAEPAASPGSPPTPHPLQAHGVSPQHWLRPPRYFYMSICHNAHRAPGEALGAQSRC